MKAIAVFPRQPGSAHLRDIAEPDLDQVPDGRGVKVRVIRVGLDGTDKEINAGEYGAPPPGDDFLVIGHESFGVVSEARPVERHRGQPHRRGPRRRHQPRVRPGQQRHGRHCERQPRALRSRRA